MIDNTYTKTQIRGSYILERTITEEEFPEAFEDADESSYDLVFQVFDDYWTHCYVYMEGYDTLYWYESLQLKGKNIEAEIDNILNEYLEKDIQAISYGYMGRNQNGMAPESWEDMTDIVSRYALRMV